MSEQPDKMAEMRAKVEKAKADKAAKEIAAAEASQNAEQLVAQEFARVQAEREAYKAEAGQQIEGIDRDIGTIDANIDETKSMLAELPEDNPDFADLRVELSDNLSKFETEIAELSQGARDYEKQLAGPEATVEAEKSQEVSIESVDKQIDTLKSSFRTDIDNKKVTPDQLAQEISSPFELSEEFEKAAQEAIQELLSRLPQEYAQNIKDSFNWRREDDTGNLSQNLDLSLIINSVAAYRRGGEGDYESIQVALEKHKDVFLRALTENAERLAKKQAIGSGIKDVLNGVDFTPKETTLVTNKIQALTVKERGGNFTRIPASLQRLESLQQNLTDYLKTPTENN